MELNDDRTYVNVLPTLGILILNHNGMKWLSPLYDSIKSDGFLEVRIYLVDNASDDGSVEMTHERYPEVTVIRMPQNLGYCMAYNLAMPHAFSDGCDWVIWANNDVRLEPGCLRELIRVARSDARIGVVGPGFLAWEKDEPNSYIIGNHPYAIAAMKSQNSEPIDVEWVEGSFLMVSRKCIESVGPLDPYLYFYWEEADFCRRARFRGWRVILVPSALARHYSGGSSTGDQQKMAKANQLRSRNYYIYKLTNPFHGFMRNFMDAFHLFLVNIKCYFPNQMSLVKFHAKVFATILSDIHRIHKKWVRDRAGKHPMATTPGLGFISVKVLSGQDWHAPQTS